MFAASYHIHNCALYSRARSFLLLGITFSGVMQGHDEGAPPVADSTNHLSRNLLAHVQ